MSEIENINVDILEHYVADSNQPADDVKENLIRILADLIEFETDLVNKQNDVAAMKSIVTTKLEELGVDLSS